MEPYFPVEQKQHKIPSTITTIFTTQGVQFKP